jgi:SAM-dependent methyltransferase
MPKAGPDRVSGDPARAVEYFEQLYRDLAEPWDYSQRAGEVLRHEFVHQLAAKARPRYRRALDVGCSMGQLTSRLVGLAPEVHGIDVSPTAIARARTHCASMAAAAGAAGTTIDFHFAVGSAAQVPFPDESFDLVLLCDGLFSWKLPAALERKVLEEAHRVLAPGGCAIFTDYMKPARSDAFFAAVEASPLRVVSRHLLNDRYWFRMEGWLRPLRHLDATRRLLRSRRVARAIMAASRPLGKFGTKHFGVLATK